jgi:hypothetical protein
MAVMKNRSFQAVDAYQVDTFRRNGKFAGTKAITEADFLADMGTYDRPRGGYRLSLAVSTEFYTDEVVRLTVISVRYADSGAFLRNYYVRTPHNADAASTPHRF